MATTAAMCAVACKPARVCRSPARHGTQYEAARVHQQSAAGGARANGRRVETVLTTI
ncbi:MAG: hypothetical protein ACR2JW_04930 [Thermomicrobiales bacterium]